MKEAELKTGQSITRISGQKAFTLFDTYGFPVEMTEEIAKEQGIEIDNNEVDY